MRILLFSFLTLSLALFVGCSKQPVESPAAAAPVNDHCPIMGGEVTPEGGTVEWNGNTVGFCCPQCIDEWQALSDADKTDALAHAGKEHSGQETHSHEDQDGKDNPEAEDSGQAS